MANADFVVKSVILRTLIACVTKSKRRRGKWTSYSFLPVSWP